MDMADDLMDVFARQVSLPEIGLEGQQRIMQASVLVVGLGGLGCPVALYLAGAGIGRMGLADPDCVSLSNLHRQLLYGRQDVGTSKAAAACRRLRQASHTTRFETYPEGLTPENAREIIAGYDIVVDCCDNHATRYLLDDICASMNKPWVYGAISGFSGIASCFMPAARVRYSGIYPDRAELSAAGAASGGVIGPTPGIVGCIQAAEALKLAAGITPALDGRILTVNLLTMDFQLFDL